MTLDPIGNYHPWSQPWYGQDAEDRDVVAPDGYEIIAEGDKIPDLCAVYAGWMEFSGEHYHSGWGARSGGRWTTWARKV